MSDTENPEETELEAKISDNKATATAYVPEKQYKRWKVESSHRNQSTSSFIASMVEAGRSKIELEEESPSDVIEVRRELRKTKAECRELRKELEQKEKASYQVGYGRIKDLIISNPGIDQREIANHLSENSIVFAEEYLSKLESTDYTNRDGSWYPPSEAGDAE